MSSTVVFSESPESLRNGRTSGMKAFISAPAGVDTRPLRLVLQRLGISGLTVEDVVVPGMQLMQAVLDALREVDVVIGVFGSEVNANVAYEIGIARGLGKRLLLIGDTKERSAVDLFGGPYIRTTSADSEAVEFALRQILAAPLQVDRSPMEPVLQTHPIYGLADDLLTSLHEGNSKNESELIDLVRRAVEASGVTAASRDKGGNVEIDLAVWSDDLEPWVKNPLIIEVKANLRSSSDVHTVVERVSKYMQKTHVSTALVLYASGTVNWMGVVTPPNILFMTIGDFVESLRTSGFGSIVRVLRSKAIDGVR